MEEKIDNKSSSALQWSFFSVLFGFTVFIGLLAFIWLLRDLLSPVFIGLLLAFIFHPIIDWTGRHLRWPALLTLSLLLLILVVIVSGLGIWLVPLVFNQIAEFMQNLPGYLEDLLQLLSGEPIKLGEDIRSRLSDFAGDPEKIIPLLLRGTVRSVGIFVDVFSVTSYVIIYILLLFVFIIAFSLHLSDIGNWAGQFLPRSRRERIINTLKKIYDAAGSFFRVRLLIALILGGLLSVGWLLAGVPYWLLLGLASGLLSIIPYAAALGWLTAILINALEAPSPEAVFYAIFWPTLVYFIVQIFEGWFLTPYLQGEKLHIHPVIVLFAVLAGGSLAGLLGMLLAIPFTAGWQIVFADLIKPRLLRWAEQH